MAEGWRGSMGELGGCSVRALGGREARRLVGERVEAHWTGPYAKRTFQSSSFRAQVCFSQLSSSRSSNRRAHARRTTRYARGLGGRSRPPVPRDWRASAPKPVRRSTSATGHEGREWAFHDVASSAGLLMTRRRFEFALKDAVANRAVEQHQRGRARSGVTKQG
jgi:hypothetical protein